MWSDNDTGMIVLKTSDKSLHMIHNKAKIWTRSFGLGSIVKLLHHENNIIVIFYYQPLIIGFI